MHCHADYADGTGTAEWNHDYARNKARLDFYSLTDHIYSTPGRATGAFNRPPVLDVRKMWGEVQRTARDWHEPGRFVTFLGYERTPWERRRAAGDLTVWFMEDDADLVIEDTIAETIAAVRETNGAVFIGSHAAQRSDWARYPDDVEDVMPTIEISAMHQHAEWYVFEGLQRGYKFASVGMADEHTGHPGYDVWPRFGQGGTPRRPFAVRSALTAVFAPELSASRRAGRVLWATHLRDDGGPDPAGRAGERRAGGVGSCERQSGRDAGGGAWDRADRAN